MHSARITSFLVKLASRCNLDCDYCYVYHHADQTWRSMPRLMSMQDRDAFATRLKEYVAGAGLKRVAVIVHGGEPLMAGADVIASFARRLRETVGAGVELDIGLQTNGMLLTDRVLDLLEAERVSLSLSLDGPREVNDLHRTTRRGRSSYDRVMAGLELLKRRPAVFAGVIAVVDPRVPPDTLLSFFSGHSPPKVDFLLPDSHHGRPPPGRQHDPGLYERWLIEAFDLWFDRYPELRVRTFEALLDAIAGLSSGTDAFGLGDVSLITIETDGSYHDLDVLKVVGEGATRLEGSVRETPISTVASSMPIAAHRRLLSKDGLSPTCKQCVVVDVCGGGSVPHRFGNGGFENPTIYCREMKHLISHIRHRLQTGLAVTASSAPGRVLDLDPAEFELAESAEPIMAELCTDARAVDAADLDAIFDRVSSGSETSELLKALLRDLPAESRRRLVADPGLVAWRRAYVARQLGHTLYDVEGRALSPDLSYLKEKLGRVPPDGLAVGEEDRWLREPFGTSIVFESAEIAERARPAVAEALDIVRRWRPALHGEILAICRAVQFVRDPTAHPEKIVSFSDNCVPGTLFVSVRRGNWIIDPFDLADSLIHEHRHQKLYLLERRFRMTEPGAVVVSPWRQDLRPPSGLLHAVFVFVELRRFWKHVRDSGPEYLRARALSQLAETEGNLASAHETLRGCSLTEPGRALAAILETQSAA